jgi:hypothetical protein
MAVMTHDPILLFRDFDMVLPPVAKEKTCFATLAR